MDVESDAQRLKEEAEIRARDERRRRELEEAQLRQEQEIEMELQRKREEKKRIAEEEKRRRLAEEEWKKLGSDVIQPLSPVPPSFVNDSDPNALKAWYLNRESSNPTYCTASLKKGRKAGAQQVTLKLLRALGVVYFNVNLNDFTIVKQIVKERGYKHTEEVRLSQTSKDEHHLEKWFQEHFSEDEQVRIITEGSCFFDIRSPDDSWIRIHAHAGDLLVFAPGLYMRGTLDEDDYCAQFRIFHDLPRWAPLFRSDPKVETNPARLRYLKMLKKGNVALELGFQ